MDAAQSSDRLLAHFENYPTVEHAGATKTAYTRGITWVMQWAIAIATLLVATGVLVEFGYCLAAELALSRAARAGVLEATLPRATYQSISQSVERRLARWPQLTGHLQLTLLQNGAAIRPAFRPADGDQLSLSLTVPSRAAMPRWLRALNFWRADSQIEVHAERQMPGRHLRTI